jgi:hypothetical protein
MDAALKKSVITLNSQFRDFTDDPNSCDFTTNPGFIQGLHGNTSYSVQSGRPLFYGIEKIALLDATFIESANNSPVSTTTTGFAAADITGLNATSLTNFPDSGTVYVESTGEEILYNSKVSGGLDFCIRGYNGTTAAVAGATTLYLVGEPYFYVRLSEPAIGPFEAVEMSSVDNHYNRFFAKVPIDTSKLDTYQLYNHDGKWSEWSNWVNFGQPFPYIEKLRMQTFRFYGNTRYEWPNPNSDYTKSLPLNLTLKVDAHENKMWDNRGVIVDASENDSESSGEEEGFF